MIKWIEHLCIVGSFQVIFLICSFVLKKENKKANLLLSSLLILIALDLISIYWKVVGQELYIPFISRLMFSSVYLYGPIIYIYTKIQTGSLKFSRKSLFFQIIPPSLSIILLLLVNPNKFIDNPPKLFFIYT